jgi:aminoglycoside/choline kinase family phosphotransferase
MNKEMILFNLENLFKKTFKEKIIQMEALAQSGSSRKYFRIYGEKHQVIGAYNPDSKENHAFLDFTKHFTGKNLCVPPVYAEDPDKNSYLIKDLGDITLFSFLQDKRSKDNPFPEQLIAYYRKAIDNLLKFQFIGGEGLNYVNCYPRSRFDKQSMLWDLNYFKYYFVKLAGITFNEQDLEKDFDHFTDYLLKAEADYFMYRDFQSRNIMIYNSKLYFIDYQGGRKGPLQYDLASLLFDAKADIPQSTRNELLRYYLEQVQQYRNIHSKTFIELYYAFVLIRIMQAFGAYGYRGFYEKKQHFLQSIPYALNNLKWILETQELPVKFLVLKSIFKQLIESPYLKELEYHPQPGLTVKINSFSYKRNIPIDNSGNGGGFVFDCRFLPNPGRIEEYKELNGQDAEVIQYLEKHQTVDDFFHNVVSIVEMAIKNYVDRKFTDLMISFGCTGGQHRSVYFANRLAEELGENKDIRVQVKHVEQEIRKQ